MQIEAFLNIEGVEGDIDQWCTTGQHKGVYTDITKACVWKEIIDHEGEPFFWTEQVNGWQTGPGNEIRLGVHMAINWYVIHLYFTCKSMLMSLQVFLGLQQSLSKCFICPTEFCCAKSPR